MSLNRRTAAIERKFENRVGVTALIERWGQCYSVRRPADSICAKEFDTLREVEAYLEGIAEDHESGDHNLCGHPE